MELDFENSGLTLGKISLVFILGAMVLFVTENPEKAEGECYTKVETCQGIDTMGCIGKEVSEIEFVSKDKCDVVENVTTECQTLRRAICRSDKLESKGWSKKAEVYGRSCGRWIDEYNLNISNSC